MVGFGGAENIDDASDTGSALEKIRAMQADNAKYAADPQAKIAAGSSSGYSAHAGTNEFTLDDE